jgi:hypothetical protein
MMACVQEQGRAEQAAQVNTVLHAMSITVCMQHSGVQDGNVALLCCLLTAQHAQLRSTCAKFVWHWCCKVEGTGSF